ncbi:poly-gamma-glutamate hydrolase family protein [Streptomyces sp. NPDC021080]|uniref:poly-gamma-glutamate hydrolase family protein n=1 Tax=Streptomyces sp. NPDC021080 TaxID=3365110 RepID=UPI0037A34AD0
MADLYANYAALAAARQIGVDYRLLVRTPPGSRLAHVAVHGGGIEPGTTEVADYLAGSASRFYSFDGMLSGDNSDLHITSTNFDEPQALALVAASDYVISWHGSAGTDPVTYIGGLDTDTGTRIKEALEAAGFTVGLTPTELDGSSTSNITNRGFRAMGVQVEMTNALRQSFFEDFTRSGRDSGPRTADFYAYMTAVRTALNGLDVPGKALGSIWRDRVARPVNSAGGASGDFGIPALAPLTVDGMPLDAVKDALRLKTNGRQVSSNGGERFWSSAPRSNGDPLREVFEFSLSSDRPVNRVAFSLARFPQRAWVQWRDRDGVWHPLTHSRSQAPVQISVMDSLPAIIPTGVPDATKLHPQHFGAGHWMPQMIDVTPVNASRFRVIMTRLPSSAAPVASDGRPVAYSLGVKDAQVSYRASSTEDLPWLAQEDAEYTAAFAGSTDLLGSQIEYSVRRNRAANLLPPAQGIWRCAPQPVPNAVVSLHLDLRDSFGKPQVIDRLYMEPLTSGPAVNVYYTDQTAVPEQFSPATTPLTLPLVRPSAELPTADSSGVLFDSPLSYLDVDNRSCQFVPSGPFLLAMVVNPQFTSDDLGQWTVLDCGQLTVGFDDGCLIARLGDRTVELDRVTFGVNSSFPVAVAYDGQVLTVRTPWDRREQHDLHIPSDPPSTIRLGGPLSGGGGAMRIQNLLLAQGRAADIETIEAYWLDPAGYALPPGLDADPAAHTSGNAILRMDPSLITAGAESVCPWGLIGGPAVGHDTQVWTPVPGDFTLRKGLLKFRPIKAAHVKLEFTNLAPLVLTPSQSSPIVKTQLFPSDSGQGSSPGASPGNSQSGAAPTGARVATDQSFVYRYVDSRSLVTADSSAAYLPTEALYAPDPLDAQVLRRSGQQFPYQPLPGTRAPRFTTTGVHQYRVAEIAMDTKVGYTVALSQVLAYLSDPVAQRDTEQYVELFHDTAYLSGYTEDDPTGWKHSGSAMVTGVQPPWLGSKVTSKTFISKRRVLGVQFAAQASDPKQLVKDPDFDDESLHFWRPVGDAVIESSSQYAASIGRMAKVTRGHATSSWGALEVAFPTWGDFEDSNPLPNRPLWWEIENATSEADNGGIESLRPVTPAPGGRLYAAARVYTEGPLEQPLLLQLVNGDGRILAEAEQAIDAAQVVEWYVGATVRTTSPTGLPTWDSVSASGTRSWDQMEGIGSWGDVSQDWSIDDVFDVRVRVVQEGSSGTGQWLVDSLTIFNDPLVWEVSRDGGVTWHEMVGIRNNPRGVFIFPDLPPEDRTGGTQLRWRVTGYSAGLSVSSMVLRPWYATLSGAVPYLDTLQAAGAATSLADYYPPVESDPLFQGWQQPIPQEWWLAARQWALQNYGSTGPLPDITLPDVVAVGTDEGNPPAPSHHALPNAFVLNR